MNSQILQLIIFVIEQAVQQVPAFVSDLRAIFAAGTPTAADFAALRAKVASESYAQFVPASALESSSAAPEVLTSSAQVQTGPLR